MLVHLKVTPQHYDCRCPFIHLGEERQCGIKFLFKGNTTQEVGLNHQPPDQKSVYINSLVVGAFVLSKFIILRFTRSAQDETKKGGYNWLNCSTTQNRVRWRGIVILHHRINRYLSK